MGIGNTISIGTSIGSDIYFIINIVKKLLLYHKTFTTFRIDNIKVKLNIWLIYMRESLRKYNEVIKQVIEATSVSSVLNKLPSLWYFVTPAPINYDIKSSAKWEFYFFI